MRRKYVKQSHMTTIKLFFCHVLLGFKESPSGIEKSDKWVLNMRADLVCIWIV